jgi:hypothetical protein
VRIPKKRWIVRAYVNGRVSVEQRYWRLRTARKRRDGLREVGRALAPLVKTEVKLDYDGS